MHNKRDRINKKKNYRRESPALMECHLLFKHRIRAKCVLGHGVSVSLYCQIAWGVQCSTIFRWSLRQSCARARARDTLHYIYSQCLYDSDLRLALMYRCKLVIRIEWEILSASIASHLINFELISLFSFFF